MKFYVQEMSDLLSKANFPSVFEIPITVINGREEVDTSPIKEALEPYYGEIKAKSVVMTSDSRKPNNAIQDITIYDRVLSYDNINAAQVLVKVKRDD